MKLAHLAPISCMPFLPKQEVHLILNDLFCTNYEYAQFAYAYRTAGRTVILDNPVHEYVPFNPEQWEYAVRALQPTIVGLPDVIESADETVHYANAYAKRVAELSPKSEIMGVAHGDTDIEFVECAVELQKQGCEWIGISLERRLKDDRQAFLLRRTRLQLLLSMLPRPSRFHFLGVSEEAREFDDDLIQDNVTSADTSEFVVWNLLGTPVEPPAPITIHYPGREALGGTKAYFTYNPFKDTKKALGMDIGAISENLARWTEYAAE